MTELDRLLTQALNDLAGQAPGLPPLSPRARRRIRAGRAGAILVSVVLAAGVSAGLAAGAVVLNRTLRSAGHGPPRHLEWSVTTSGGNDAIAVGRSALYVATGDVPGAMLSAYSRATGRLIGQVRVPGLPRALRAGPGGSVWLTFYPDQNGGATGLWLLTAGLRRHSSLSSRLAGSISLNDLLPVGPADALVAGAGLEDLHLPGPGEHGTATLRPVAAIRASHGYSGAAGIARLAGRIALLQEDQAQDFRIVLAGAQSRLFDPGRGVTVSSVAGGGNGLWISTGPQPAGPGTGAVIRLDDQLRDVTPRSVRNNPMLAYPDQVSTTRDTVVVSTFSLTRPLACFRFRNGAGPVTAIPVRLPPGLLAVTGQDIYAADAQGVITYQLPAACR